MTRCALVLLAACLLAADKDDAAKADTKKFEGTWVMVSAIDDGTKSSGSDLGETLLIVKGDTHDVNVRGTTYKGTHKLDPAKKPKTIDVMDTEGPFKDKTLKGIYELSGDEFKFCYAPPGKDRPKDFTAAAGSGHHCHVWKRKK